MFKLKPYERMLIETRINRFKVVGPGLVWLRPWQKALATFNVGFQSQSLRFESIRTLEEVNVDITAQILYQIDLNLFSDDLLSNIPALNVGGWQNILRWRFESVLRLLVTAYSWRDLKQSPIQQQLQRRLTLTLATLLEGVGLRVTEVILLKIELPINLQKSLIQAEQDAIEARGRAVVLKEYSDIFGEKLPQAMPHIMRWEFMNLLHRRGDPQLLMFASNLFEEGGSTNPREIPPSFNIGLPSDQAKQNGKTKEPRKD